MKLCMCVGYHDANNVSNFGGDPIKCLKRLKSNYRFTATVFPNAAVCAWSRSISHKNCDRVTAMERHARKTLVNNTRFVNMAAMYISYKYMLLVWPT